MSIRYWEVTKTGDADFTARQYEIVQVEKNLPPRVRKTGKAILAPLLETIAIELRKLGCEEAALPELKSVPHDVVGMWMHMQPLVDKDNLALTPHQDPVVA